MADELDPIDARILDILQQDAGLSVAEVADRVGLSASPCWRRIKRLEDSGLIRKRVTLLDAGLLGLDFEVYAIVKLSLPTRDNLQ
ncbi:winged helix-turn-helix transcriptional regulator, partial [Aeromonas caviae]